MTKTHGTTPHRHQCGSHEVAATSSTQYRVIDGVRWQAAEAVCNNRACGNSWWGLNASVLAPSKMVDADRKAKQ